MCRALRGTRLMTFDSSSKEKKNLTLLSKNIDSSRLEFLECLLLHCNPANLTCCAIQVFETRFFSKRNSKKELRLKRRKGLLTLA